MFFTKQSLYCAEKYLALNSVTKCDYFEIYYTIWAKVILVNLEKEKSNTMKVDT